MKTSKGDINRLCRIIQAKNNLGSGDPAIFENADEMYAAIDELDVEAAGWETFRVRYVFLSLIASVTCLLRHFSRYNGPIAPNAPSWKRQTYIVHTRNVLAIVKHMAANPEFDGKWDYSPFEEFTPSGSRRWSDFMSGHWSWKEAVSRDHLRPLTRF